MLIATILDQLLGTKLVEDQVTICSSCHTRRRSRRVNDGVHRGHCNMCGQELVSCAKAPLQRPDIKGKRVKMISEEQQVDMAEWWQLETATWMDQVNNSLKVWNEAKDP